MAKYVLKAPKEFWDLIKNSPNDIKRISNGCGPKKLFFGSDIGDALVPDTIWGLSICKACDIHDFMYTLGITEKDKEVADRIFLDNMFRIIDQKNGYSWMRVLRRKRAEKYYKAVSNMGENAFLKNAEAKKGFGKLSVKEY